MVGKADMADKEDMVEDMVEDTVEDTVNTVVDNNHMDTTFST
jgi:hypothetical protein